MSLFDDTAVLPESEPVRNEEARAAWPRLA